MFFFSSLHMAFQFFLTKALYWACVILSLPFVSFGIAMEFGGIQSIDLINVTSVGVGFLEVRPRYSEMVSSFLMRFVWFVAGRPGCP